MKYRAEIDGLRALAVIPVILFHAGFDVFRGGYVGVDVFFVISGYLITTILVEEIENKRFSILNFYERRARRILPALGFVMLACIPFAWLWMLPGQLRDFSQSLIAVSFFASNILFWQESGYFDAAAEEKPLLHTWSLAVEEQYYLLFPVLLLLTWRFGKHRVFWMIVGLAAISLLLSEWGWRNHATANFYLAPSRAWELFAGSIAAFIVQKRGVRTSNLLSLGGLAAIIFALFFYDDTTPFPSIYTLVPVMGVVLLVLYADRQTLAAKILSTRVFVGVGLISYSAYLWHQPLFAFARIRLTEEPGLPLMLLLSTASIVLAVFSWRYVEQPFRNRAAFQRKSVFILSGASIVSFSGISAIAILSIPDLSQGYLFSEETVKAQMELRFLPRQEICRSKGWSACDRIEQGKHNVLVIGDSHAADALNALYYATQHRLEEISYSSSDLGGCGAYLETREHLPTKWPNLEECIELNETQRFNTAFLNQYDTIAISFLLGRYTEADLIKYLEFLDQHFTGEVLVFGSTFTFKEHLPDYLNRGGSEELIGELIKFDPSIREAEIREFAENHNMNFFSKLDAFCPQKKCEFISDKGILMTYDDHHLSIDYSQQLAAHHEETLLKTLLSSDKD